MAFITAKEVKSIRVALKKKYPNLKFSVKKKDCMSVNVSIMKGDLDFTNILEGRDYISINHFYPENYDNYKKLIEDITDIIKTAPANEGGKEWFDDSDPQSDYFHTAYYFSINIGQFDKGYVQV